MTWACINPDCGEVHSTCYTICSKCGWLTKEVKEKKKVKKDVNST